MLIPNLRKASLRCTPLENMYKFRVHVAAILFLIAFTACKSSLSDIQKKISICGISKNHHYEVIESENSPAIGEEIETLFLKIPRQELHDIVNEFLLDAIIKDTIIDERTQLLFGQGFDKKRQELKYRTNVGYNYELYSPNSGFEYTSISIDTINSNIRYFYQDE